MRWPPRKFAGNRDISSNNYNDPSWISRCDRCGELVASDKPFLVAAHQRWCASRSYYRQPRDGGRPPNAMAESQGTAVPLAVLALTGIAIGAMLSLLAIA